MALAFVLVIAVAALLVASRERLDLPNNQRIDLV
jgi:hypothetical protein